MREKEKIGIEELDNMLGGGIPRGAIVLVKGTAGTEKSTFLRSFLQEGIKTMQTGVYFLPHRDPEFVLEDMRLFNWDIDTSKIKFLVYQGIVKKREPYVIGNFDSLTTLLSHARETIESEKNQKRCIFDMLSSYFIANEQTKVLQFLQLLFKILRENNVTTLLQIQEDAHDPKLIAILESMTDGTIELKREKEKKYVMISRMANADIKIYWQQFEIKTKIGVKIIEFFK